MTIRYPAVAGMFYPVERVNLEKVAKGYLGQAKKVEIKDQLMVLIVPHAGYEYSGQVAAAGFKQIESKNDQEIILLGASHSAWFPGVAVYNQGVWETPLGKVEVDEKLAERLIDPDFQIVEDQQAHRNEHSLEVQLPLLQSVLRNFKVVPLLIGQAQEESLKRLADLISSIFRVEKSKPERLLLVVSSDLSHYPDYETAKIVDEKTVEVIKAGDWRRFDKTLDQLRNQFPQVDTFCCGASAVKVGLMVAEKLKAQKAIVFEQKNSGDLSARSAGEPAGRQSVGGDKTRVVGYVSIGFYK